MYERDSYEEGWNFQSVPMVFPSSLKLCSFVRHAADTFLGLNKRFRKEWSTPSGAQSQCCGASEEFIRWFAYRELKHTQMIGLYDGWHMAILIQQDGTAVVLDFTARQFDAGAPFPMVRCVRRYLKWAHWAWENDNVTQEELREQTIESNRLSSSPLPFLY